MQDNLASGVKPRLFGPRVALANFGEERRRIHDDPADTIVAHA